MVLLAAATLTGNFQAGSATVAGVIGFATHLMLSAAFGLVAGTIYAAVVLS